MAYGKQINVTVNDVEYNVFRGEFGGYVYISRVRTGNRLKQGSKAYLAVLAAAIAAGF